MRPLCLSKTTLTSALEVLLISLKLIGTDVSRIDDCSLFGIVPRRVNLITKELDSALKINACRLCRVHVLVTVAHIERAVRFCSEVTHRFPEHSRPRLASVIFHTVLGQSSIRMRVADIEATYRYPD